MVLFRDCKVTKKAWIYASGMKGPANNTGTESLGKTA
jgi:hypothetical protein